MNRLDAKGTSRLIGQEGSQTARLMVYLLLSIVLMAMDQRGHYVPRVREAAVTLFEPVFHLADLPSRSLRSISTYSHTYSELQQRNAELADQLLGQSADLQRLEALQQENARLRDLLDATSGRRFEFRFAELVQVDLDPLSHQVMIDRGSNDGVFEGQAVLDGNGVMGQVEIVMQGMASVRLISDPDHALPVQILRTGLRTVAFGTGETGSLLLPNVPLQADVRPGDELVTSGLGDRFPSGFPVAIVETVERQPGEMFASVVARPLAALDRGREVLLVLPRAPAPETQTEVRPEAESAGSADASEPAVQPEQETERESGQ